MDKFIKSQIKGTIDINALTWILIFFLLIILVTIFWLLVFKEVSLDASIIIALIIFLIFIFYTPSFYENRILYNTEKETLDISFLPNQIVNTNTYSFVINKKEMQTLKYEETSYIQDSKNKPYIIVDKVSYHIPYNILLNKSNINKINNKTVYILEEVHY